MSTVGGPTPPPYTPPPGSVQARRQSGLATAALVLGILSLVLGFALAGLGVVLAIIALVFTGVSMRQVPPISNASAARIGAWLAGAGLLVSIVGGGIRAVTNT